MSKVVDRKLLRKTEDVSFANNSLVDSETGDRCFTDTHFHRTGHSLHRRRSPVYAAQSRVDSVQVVDYHWSLETLKRWYILFVWQQSRLALSLRPGRNRRGVRSRSGCRTRKGLATQRDGIHVPAWIKRKNTCNQILFIILNKKIGFFFSESPAVFSFISL